MYPIYLTTLPISKPINDTPEFMYQSFEHYSFLSPRILWKYLNFGSSLGIEPISFVNPIRGDSELGKSLVTSLAHSPGGILRNIFRCFLHLILVLILRMKLNIFIPPTSYSSADYY